MLERSKKLDEYLKNIEELKPYIQPETIKNSFPFTEFSENKLKIRPEKRNDVKKFLKDRLKRILLVPELKEVLINEIRNYLHELIFAEKNNEKDNVDLIIQHPDLLSSAYLKVLCDCKNNYYLQKEFKTLIMLYIQEKLK